MTGDNIKQGVVIFVFSLLSISLNAQLAELMIVKHNDSMETEIGVVDENMNIIYNDGITPFSDTLFLRLDYDKRYFLELSDYVLLANGKDPIISIYLNDVPVMVIHSDLDPGDHSFPFYTGVDKPALRIVGGTSVSIEDYPWQVFVRSGDFLCGGTIIADKWVLTAAHCLYDENNSKIPPEEISFTVGTDRPFSALPGENEYPVEYAVIHEDYNDLNFENDLALLRTKEVINDENARPINLVTPEDVASGATDPGVNAIITGWGLTNIDPLEFPELLQKLEVPIVSQNIAELIWGPLPESMLMAGYPDDRGDACRGDSGGPLIVKVGEEYKLAGVISWGSSGCNTIGGYIRLSSFNDWLQRNSGVGQDQFRTVRPRGGDFRCEGVEINPETQFYRSDTLSDAIQYEWKLEPAGAGAVSRTGIIAEVDWTDDFSGDAYVSVRALTPEGYTKWAGQRVETGKITRIIEDLRDTAFCQYGDITLRVEAEGADLTYTWFKDGNQILSGPKPSVFFENIRFIDEGIFNVEISGKCGNVMSSAAELTVLPETEILKIADDEVLQMGISYELETEVVGDNMQFTWKKDDVILENENNSTILIEEVNANTTGLYSLTAEGTCGTDESFPVYLYVDPGISEFPSGINIWPTLTDDFINIAVEDDEVFDIFIYDSMGKYLGRKIKCQYKTQLDFSSFAPDMYIIQIRFDRETKTYRVVKLNN